MKSQIVIVDSRQKWVPPAGLDRSRPRPVRLTGAGRALLVVAFVLVAGAGVAGVSLAVVTHRQAAETRLLREEGITHQGIVVRAWREKDDSKQPWVAYKFPSERGTFEGRSKIPLRIWRTLHEGSQLPILYVPSSPELNQPRDGSRSVIPGWLPYLIAALMTAFGLFATLPLRRQSWLLAEGRPSAGRVTRHSKEISGTHGSTQGKMFYYEFSLLSGALAKGKAGPSKNPPAIGSTISVLYDPNDARKYVLYPLQLVKLALPSRL